MNNCFQRVHEGEINFVNEKSFGRALSIYEDEGDYIQYLGWFSQGTEKRKGVGLRLNRDKQYEYWLKDGEFYFIDNQK